MSNAAVETPVDSDRTLIEQALAGDQIAFGRLVERYWRLVFAIGYAHVGERETAEDLTQEIFLRIFINLKSFDLERPFTPWLSCVARNLAINWARSGQRRSRVLVSLPDEMIDRLAQEPDRESELQAMERREEEGLLRAMLFRLPTGQREILLLHYMEGLSKSEIAERLGVHPSTVGRQLKQALRSLRGGVESALSDGAAAIRPRQQLLGRTLALVGGAAVLHGDAKAVLASAAGGLPAPGPAFSFSLPFGGGGFHSAAGPFWAGVGKFGLIAALGAATFAGVDHVRNQGERRFVWPWSQSSASLLQESHRKAIAGVRDRFKEMQAFSAASDMKGLIECYDLPDWQVLTGLDEAALRARVYQRLDGLAKVIAAAKVESISIETDESIEDDVEYSDGRPVRRLLILGPVVAVKAGDWSGRFVRNGGVWKALDQQVSGAAAAQNGVMDLINIETVDPGK